MVVRVEVTLDDHVAFLRHRSQRLTTPSRRTSFTLLVAGWVAAAVLFSWAYTATSWAPGYILSFAIGGLAGAGLLYARLGKTLRLLPEGDSPVLGIKEFSIDEGGLRVAGTGLESWTSWAVLRGVEETPEHVFLRIDRATAIILPKRGFASADEAALFVGEIGRRIGAPSSRSEDTEDNRG